MTSHPTEVAHGQRFEFGENWRRFLSVLSEERIAESTASLCRLLCTDTLEGKRFLDIGSGSGIFSLAARRLGAVVHSFDFDPSSVACTSELRRRYYADDSQWSIEEGSVLDESYVESLGKFDYVYSWGVLHHTGEMWKALGNAALAVGPSGTLCIAIYNDQGGWSRRWKRLKRIYNRLPKLLRGPYAFIVMGARELKFLYAFNTREDDAPGRRCHSCLRVA